MLWERRLAIPSDILQSLSCRSAHLWHNTIYINYLRVSIKRKRKININRTGKKTAWGETCTAPISAGFVMGDLKLVTCEALTKNGQVAGITFTYFQIVLPSTPQGPYIDHHNCKHSNQKEKGHIATQRITHIWIDLFTIHKWRVYTLVYCALPRRLTKPPLRPASTALSGLFLKLPPLTFPPFLPASDARTESSAKLPLPPRCVLIA